MDEKNKNNLKKAIDGLPKYSPKANLWDNISDAINIQEGEKALHEALSELPMHTAPDQIWSKIEQELPGTSKLKRLWLKPLAAAATVAILIGLFVINSQTSFGDEIVKVSHKELPVLKEEFVNLNQFNNTQRDSAFRTIVQSQKKISDDAKVILAELEEIRSDKAGLKSRLSKYDTNSDLQNKLRALEHEEIELEKAFLANI